jgi:hypothetical protein
MTKSNKFILEYLKGKDYTSPSEIGRAYGKFIKTSSLSYHSAWASPKCLKLVSDGKLLRNNRGWYKLV